VTGTNLKWSRRACSELLEDLAAEERLILPALQRVQASFGFVPSEAVSMVADLLNVSVADVHGVLTFYHDLRTTEPAPITIAVCAAEACQASGSAGLIRHVEASVAPVGSRSSDDQVDVTEVFCLGNCALGPAATVNGRLWGRLDESRIDDVIADARAAAQR